MIDIHSLVEVKLDNPDDFLKVKETLTRIGIASKSENRLFQSCYILHKQGRYFVVHFKELFALDGRESTFSESDLGRRNKIAQLLEDWGLVTIVNPGLVEDPQASINQIKILPHKEKDDWELVSKYSIGRKRAS